MLAHTIPSIASLVGCVLLLALLPACAAVSAGSQENRFDETLRILTDNTDVVLLKDEAGEERVVVAPALSARVMMAAWGGENPPRLGWVNEPVVTGEERNPAFINYGGAERLWLSPEGGQFALFFKPGDPFDLDHWWTPHTFNSDPYEIIDRSGKQVTMAREMRFKNYQGTPFSFRVLRDVTLVGRKDVGKKFGVKLPPSVHFVGYTSENTLINRGYSRLTAGKGLVSLWILSQFDATPGTWVIFPYKQDGEGGEGPLINDDYFGKVPAERLITATELGCSLFRCDSRRRTKIGLSFGRAKNVIGSIDFDRNILTVVAFNLPREGSYAANSWTIQDDPFNGDVVNSYNNGFEGKDADVPECFYELETLSPVKELEPGHRLVHKNTVMHFGGTLNDLNGISLKLLGVDLAKVKNAIRILPEVIEKNADPARVVTPRDQPSRVPRKKEEGRFK